MVRGRARVATIRPNGAAELRIRPNGATDGEIGKNVAETMAEKSSAIARVIVRRLSNAFTEFTL